MKSIIRFLMSQRWKSFVAHKFPKGVL